MTIGLGIALKVLYHRYRQICQGNLQMRRTTYKGEMVSNAYWYREIFQ